MGRIIVKNIGRMGWKAKIGLIALFTLVFSLLIYQGRQQLRNADAAVTMSAWTTLYTGTAYPTATSVAYTVPTGNNRLLVVAVASNRSAIGAQSATITYGGQPLILANGDMTTTTVRQHSAIYYLNESGIKAATTSNFALTVGTGTANGVAIYATTLTNVDQSTPIAASQIKTPSTTTTLTPIFVTALTTNANDKSISIMNAFRTASGTASVATAAANWTMPTTGTAGNMTVVSGTTYVMRAAAFDRAIPTTATTSTAPGTLGTAVLVSMTGVSFKAATTTLASNPVPITAANVAPGSTNKLGSFSLVTTGFATGTTDSVTGLTVTTTNPTTIASMSIWNEAGTTQYFSTVTNPATTSTFSGGTPLPVTSNAANFKIMVTYKDRASFPTTSDTITSAYVSAFTPTTGVAAGTYTVGSSLTVLNTHNPITWGTNSASTSLLIPQITLNWAYSGPPATVGRGALVVRYAGANTDTQKPVDGTQFGINTSFGSGTVRYVGTATTLTDTLVEGNTTYYYKIFEYDSFNNYYTTDNWTPTGLKPISSDGTAPTVDAGFGATTPVNTLTVPLTANSLSATDNSGGSGVSGYKITTTPTQPTASETGWTSAPPTTYPVAGQGTYILYPWAKDQAGNVSTVYGAPVTVVVDQTAPTVSTFTAPATSKSRTITITDFTAVDTGGSGVSAYQITTSSTAPTAGSSSWSVSKPTSYTVPADTTYTLYPWVKDAAGNVSAVATPLSVIVDATPPTGLALSSPADLADNLSRTVTLSVTAASDSHGPVEYNFYIADSDLTTSQQSGWQSGISWTPATLDYSTTYNWKVMARDSYGNTTDYSTPYSFNVGAACVRSDPIMTLLNASNGVASTISTDGGTAAYTLKIINGDYGGCGDSTFTLSTTDSDLDTGNGGKDVFVASTLSTSQVTLSPTKTTTVTVTVKAKSGIKTGGNKTTVQAAANSGQGHAATSSGRVQTTLNVVDCTKNVPQLIIGPNTGFVNKGGTLAYTVTVKNTNTGTGCSSDTFTLSTADSNTSSFDASILGSGTASLGAAENSSITLLVKAKNAATTGAINTTTIGVTASGYTSPTPATATTTVGNPMLHNSDNVGSTKWSANGGWGVPGKRYGEFDCITCHVDGNSDTGNIKRVREIIYTPYTSNSAPKLPGHGQPIKYDRMADPNPTKGSLGFDDTTKGATPRSSSSKVCEVCHTYDVNRQVGVMAHPYNSNGATLPNHMGSDGVKDCVFCHKHNKGFGGNNISCNLCHGDSSVENVDASNRWAAAPPRTTLGDLIGTLSGDGNVSNNPKVGAHQTHIKFTLGFSNYSTYDFRCQNCHGPVPVGASHANGVIALPFDTIGSNRGNRIPTLDATTRTCNNTYCHNPTGSGGTLKGTVVGTAIQPSWTSASLLLPASSNKTVANCQKCHLVPGSTNFSYQSSHGSNVTSSSYDCSGCHGHNGDATGEVGKRHIDGIRYAAGYCNSCHDYDTIGTTWGTEKGQNYSLTGEGIGAHAKHINFLKTRWGIASLAPTTDVFGAGNAAKICGTCHTNTLSNHMSGNRAITFGDGSSTVGSIAQPMGFGASAAVYNGSSDTSSNDKAKTCSNLSCHYFTTPVWSTY